MNNIPLVSMIALAQGTVVGSIGIVHVDPDNQSEDGRYSHPQVPEDVAVLLEQARLAKRDGKAEPAPVEPVDPASGIVKAIEPSALRDPAVQAVAASNEGLVQIPAEPVEPVATDAEAIETGLGDDDPDAPPAPKRGPKAK
ncbi:MAG: hypothetical protein K2X76_05175 [Sphingomonas sp.]|nr:hypothetical protein [Sphingomonas sp.]